MGSNNKWPTEAQEIRNLGWVGRIKSTKTCAEELQVIRVGWNGLWLEAGTRNMNIVICAKEGPPQETHPPKALWPSLDFLGFFFFFLPRSRVPTCLLHRSSSFVGVTRFATQNWTGEADIICMNCMVMKKKCTPQQYTVCMSNCSWFKWQTGFFARTCFINYIFLRIFIQLIDEVLWNKLTGSLSTDLIILLLERWLAG